MTLADLELLLLDRAIEISKDKIHQVFTKMDNELTQLNMILQESKMEGKAIVVDVYVSVDGSECSFVYEVSQTHRLN